MDKYKKIFQNSLVFAIGNFGSRFISLFMVPLYTFVLSTNDYGKIDLLTNTISLLIPFITLALDQAVVRFTMSNKSKKIFYLSTALYVYLGIFTLFVMIACPLIYLFSIFQEYTGYFFVTLFLNGLQLILLQFCRGVGQLQIYALNGILQTFIFASMNFICLVELHWGIIGYYFSMIVGLIVSISYLLIVTKAWSFIKLTHFSKEVSKEMLNYSLPLIPSGTMWWLVNNSTRYVVLFFLGVTGNGLFAVATKLPTVINIFTSIFTQAWQLSAFEEYEAEDQSNFYSTVFQIYYQLLFIVSSVVLIIVLPITTFMISEDFFDSWKMIAALILGTIFQTLASFLGSIYTATMKTKGVFSSSLIGALISIGSNFLFIPLFGISGAGFGTVIGFFIMFLIRLRDTKKLVNTRINVPLFSSNIALFVLQAITLNVTYQNLILNISNEIFLFVICLIINRNFFKQIYLKFNKN